jgi:predicted dehydrogenase
MQTKPVRIGIIGLGAIGGRLLTPLKKLHTSNEIEIAAVCDVNEGLAKQVSAELDGIPYYTSHNTLLEGTDVDLVYVAVPPAYHHRIVLDVLQAKKHVFCEKPLANSVEEAQEMLEAAEQAGVVHAMHFPLNYSASLHKFSQLVNEGYLGELKRISLVMHFPQWPRAWQQNNWIDSREQGGFVLEVGVHWIQAIQKVFGPITNILSELQFPADPTKCENGIIARMTLADGTPILVDGLSHLAGEEHIALIAYGTEGTLTIENWRTLKGGKTGEAIAEMPVDESSDQPWIMKHVVDAIHGKPDADIYDFKVGYDAQVVLEALRNPKN